MSYGISFTSGSLIPSFCLSIKGRHDAPSLSLCSDGKKSDLALYVYEFLLFLSAPCGGRLLNKTDGIKKCKAGSISLRLFKLKQIEVNNGQKTIDIRPRTRYNISNLIRKQCYHYCIAK